MNEVKTVYFEKDDNKKEERLVNEVLSEGQTAIVGKIYTIEDTRYVLGWTIGFTNHGSPEIVVLLDEKDDSRGRALLSALLEGMKALPIEGPDYFLAHCGFDLVPTHTNGRDPKIDVLVSRLTSLPTYFPGGYGFILFATPDRAF